MKSNRYNQERNLFSGFTLIELLITFAIVAVVGVGSFFMFTRYSDSKNLELTSNEIMSVIRETQRKSVTQQDGKQWGIRFETATSGISSYAVWNGVSYASGTIDRLSALRRNIIFGNPPQGINIDIPFTAVSGSVSAKQSISLRGGGNPSLVHNIVIDTLGRATRRVNEGLVGYWHFDEGTSTITYDATGYGNNGTLVNGPTWQSGTNCKSGGCLNFNGSGGYITVADSDSLDLTNAFTILFWMKSSSLGQTNRYVLGKLNTVGNNNIYAVIYGYSANKIQFYDNTASDYGYPLSNSDITISDTNWHHVAYVYDGSTFNGYLDGVAITPVATSASFSVSTGDLKIASFDGTGHYLNGLLDDVRIYNRALSSEEIREMYEDLK